MQRLEFSGATTIVVIRRQRVKIEGTVCLTLSE